MRPRICGRYTDRRKDQDVPVIANGPNRVGMASIIPDKVDMDIVFPPLEPLLLELYAILPMTTSRWRWPWVIVLRSCSGYGGSCLFG